MAKKFFYNKVYNTKKTVINVIIIVVCVVGIIACFLLTSSFQKAPTKKKNVKLNNSVTVEINENFKNDIFFARVDNYDIKDAKITYSEDYDISKTGRYEAYIEIDDNKYTVDVNVVDTTRPDLTIKEVTINENEEYKAVDFVNTCTDNSNEECLIDFYADIDPDGNPVDYSKYTKFGIYPIKISAKDNNGNVTTIETKLHINKKDKEPEPEPISCGKYGTFEYDEELYTLSYNATVNSCAITLDACLTENDYFIEFNNTINKKESERLLKDYSTIVKMDKNPTIDNRINCVPSISKPAEENEELKGTGGLVGYEIHNTLSVTVNDVTEKIVEYKLDIDGKRVFIYNPYNFPE